MSIKSNIDHFIKDKKSTLLCVGPMSKNCVDATVELANEYNIPIFLIASRRQIETEYIKEGYVNNWTTQEFSKYVKSIDKNKNIILARDHGGPWQGNYDLEKNLDEKKTIDNALKSFFDDIDNNFDFIHIDTSYRIDGKKVFSSCKTIKITPTKLHVVKNVVLAEIDIVIDKKKFLILDILEFNKKNEIISIKAFLGN